MRHQNLSRNMRAAAVPAFACVAVAGWGWESEARRGGGHGAGQAAPSQPQRPSQPASGDATVEQTRKNIQVLKGLPESDLLPLMRGAREKPCRGGVRI